jgi:hypothetical protein
VLSFEVGSRWRDGRCGLLKNRSGDSRGFSGLFRSSASQLALS